MVEIYPEFHFLRYESFPDPLTFSKNQNFTTKVCSEILREKSGWDDELLNRARLILSRVRENSQLTADDYKIFSELYLTLVLEKKDLKFRFRKSYLNIQTFAQAQGVKDICRTILNGNGLSAKNNIENPVALSYAFLFKRLFIDLSVALPVLTPKSVKFHLFSELILEIKKKVLLVYKLLDIEIDFDLESDDLEVFNFFAGELCGVDVDIKEETSIQQASHTKGGVYEIEIRKSNSGRIPILLNRENNVVQVIISSDPIFDSILNDRILSHEFLAGVGEFVSVNPTKAQLTQDLLNQIIMYGAVRGIDFELDK